VHTRGLAVGVLATGLVLCTGPPASAQGGPVGGTGNHYYLAGAGNFSGKAAVDFVYGDRNDEVYFGDFVDGTGTFGGDGRDDAMVRRGNQFIIRGQQGRAFYYGDPGDVVLVGDWDGDGTDTLTVRRGNAYFVKNDINTGVADHTFVYGDPHDEVLVGNWDGELRLAYEPGPGEPTTYVRNMTDTLMVRRGAHFFLRNELTTGVADFDFYFGEPGDTVLAGDWVDFVWSGRIIDQNSNGADQIAVRRGNVYHKSEDFLYYSPGDQLYTDRTYTYGNPNDTAFTARLEWLDTPNGGYRTLTGDALGVRR
jgi:hypothetical protein